MKKQDFHMIARLEPFSFLLADELKEISSQCSSETHKKGTILCIQGSTRIKKLYIFAKGSAERFFEEGGHRTLRGKLGEGDTFGGISILLNNHISIRTLELTEDSIIYTLPSGIFLNVCKKNEYFQEYFTNIFGKRMQNRSYAGIISRQMKDRELSLPFLNQPVMRICSVNVVSCSHGTSIKNAAAQMALHKISFIFVKNKNNIIEGIVTDNDLRKRVVATGYDIHRPASEIMTSPVESISHDSQIFEAFMTMMQHDLKHLPLKDDQGNFTGVITDKDLIAAQGESPYLLIREVKQAENIKEIFNIQQWVPEVLFPLIKSGARAADLSRLVTALSDAVLHKIISFALAEKGDPPCKFAFMVMGSEEKSEQTLKTDQDNAIVYEDSSDKHQAKANHTYFLELGYLICTWLDKAGFDLCKGNNMAKNPRWCQPISVWKQYFFRWIRSGSPEDLLHSSIFFDFRGIRGELDLVDDLRAHLFHSLKGWLGFFRNLTENALYFRPPIGFFRNIVVESKGEHKNSFDLKRAMLPIVDFARIYALKHNIKATNTLSRLEQIHAEGAIDKKEFSELEQSYNYLLQLRFIRQVSCIIDEGKKADNFCNPKNLSRIDRTMLKEIFKRVEHLQQKLSVEFIGIV